MCMADGKGDVAFVKHTTTKEVVDKGGYGTVADYQYLCKEGGREGKAQMSRFKFFLPVPYILIYSLVG